MGSLACLVCWQVTQRTVVKYLRGIYLFITEFEVALRPFDDALESLNKLGIYTTYKSRMRHLDGNK